MIRLLCVVVIFFAGYLMPLMHSYADETSDECTRAVSNDPVLRFFELYVFSERSIVLDKCVMRGKLHRTLLELDTHYISDLMNDEEFRGKESVILGTYVASSGEAVGENLNKVTLGPDEENAKASLPAADGYTNITKDDF